MDILVNVVNQKLKIATNLKSLIVGTQEFIRFVFNLTSDWDGLLTFAQFRQDGDAYNQYLDEDNSVYLPAEIGTGTCTLTLYGSNGNTIGTTNYITLIIDENILVSDANSTEISESLYNQLVTKINSLTEWNGQSVADLIETDKNQQTQINNKAEQTDLDDLAMKVSQMENGENTVGLQNVIASVEQLRSDVDSLIADLYYEEIGITSFSVGNVVLESGEKESNLKVEQGAIIKDITFVWTLNKTAATITLNGESVNTNLSSITKSDLALANYKSWVINVTDERDHTASKSTAVSFLNGVYYGVLTDGVTIDSTAILSLTRKLQSAKAMSFTVNAGDNKRIAYALPEGYGTPTFTVGGFEGGFTKAATIDFTNASGYTESYDVWLSDNMGLGSTTVVVT